MKKLSCAMLCAGILFLCGCGSAPLGSSPISDKDPFVEYVNKPLTLAVPVKVCYDDRANPWVRGAFKKGEMYYFCSGSDTSEVAFEAPAGTPLVVKEVLLLPNSTDHNIIAFGGIANPELGRNVPFNHYLSFYSEADTAFGLVRAPWEPLTTPGKRLLKAGILPNQYLGVKESKR